MEIGIYITTNIIYLVRELYLGDRIGSFSLLERCHTLESLINVGRSEWVRSQKRLGALRRKDWHGLRESSYCYFEVLMHGYP